MKIAVVGATGLVGAQMLKILEERHISVDQLIPVASARSVGKTVRFKDQDWEIVTIDKALEEAPEVALFSAGGSLSKEWAQAFAEKNCWVIDNSSAWRMDPEVPLVVPEINFKAIGKMGSRVVANPNCSTIQLVVAMYPLHQAYGLERMVVSTYQAVTGTGKWAVDQLHQERSGQEAKQVYPYAIDLNCLPHCDVFEANGNTKEENKLINESRKILDHAGLGVSATAVRVPVVGGHSESVNATFGRSFSLEGVRKTLRTAPGIVLLDRPEALEYPMPIHAHGKDEVFVGRLRKDESMPQTLNLWIVADNLRKGAATNAIQIMEQLIEEKMIATAT